MAAAYLWAWNKAAGDFVKVLADADGHLQTDVLSQPDVAQSDPAKLKHLPHGYYATGPSYLPLAVDSAGKLLVTLSSLVHLTDIGDVNIPTPLDWYIIHYDAATGKWIGSYNWIAAHTVAVIFIIDGGGSAITTGQKGHLEIPFAGTITGWTILADQSGSIVVDVWKDTNANFPPTVAETITGSEKPTLATAQKNQDLTLTTWTTAIAAGDILAFNVDSASTVTRVLIALRVTRAVE